MILNERTHKADITPAGWGYDVQLRYEFEVTVPGETESTWWSMTSQPSRWALTRAGAERLGRRMIRRHLTDNERARHRWTVALCTCPMNMTYLDCPAQGIGCRWDQ